jgi:hypothetical protein
MLQNVAEKSAIKMFKTKVKINEFKIVDKFRRFFVVSIYDTI